MNGLRKAVYRVEQAIMGKAANLLDWRMPRIEEGEGALLRVPLLLHELGIRKVLIVAGTRAGNSDILHPLMQALNEQGIAFVTDCNVLPNPTVEQVEEAVRVYHAGGCDGILAYGGGSPLDCAKICGARIAKPKCSVLKMGGVLKIRKKLPPLIAVPTTAGTGSEVTLSAVITDESKHSKYTINDPSIIPMVAVLDPAQTVSMPAHITAMTGMDALTHAVEAYLNRNNTPQTEEYARKAIPAIFENLPLAYADGQNLQAREAMLRASFDAGVAFRRSYVGYVHAIAHAIGGMYGIAHGLANAILLPGVLRYYDSAVHARLAQLAGLVGIDAGSDEKNAAQFLEKIQALNASMCIPERVEQLRREDIPALARHADKEANPLYPVPVLLDAREIGQLMEQYLV